MIKQALQATITVYKHLLLDIGIAVIALAGGLVTRYFDVFGLVTLLGEDLAYLAYALAIFAVSFPVLFILSVVVNLAKQIPGKLKKIRFNPYELRLVEGVFYEGTWHENGVRSLTLVNETGQDLQECFIMLDELAWKNFEDEWEVVTEEVFSEPFKWNAARPIDGKIQIANGDRASFSLIAHHEYSIYNASMKQNETMTDFWLVFSDETNMKIGHGSNIRLKISIRGKDESGHAFEPVKYYLLIHLKQPHGIPKVDVVDFVRIKNRTT